MVIPFKRLLFWLASVVLILLVPLIAMQFMGEVKWDILDFIVMGTGLMSIGLVYELIIRRSPKRTYRIAFGLAIAAVFLLFWVNGAVGIIGNEGQAPNLLYMATIATTLIGSLISQFKSQGMSVTMFVAAGVQMLVPVVGLLIWPPPATSWSPGIAGVFLLSSFFALLLLVAAVLFRRSS